MRELAVIWNTRKTMTGYKNRKMEEVGGTGETKWVNFKEHRIWE